jgi:hypothetical protein
MVFNFKNHKGNWICLSQWHFIYKTFNLKALQQTFIYKYRNSKYFCFLQKLQIYDYLTHTAINQNKSDNKKWWSSDNYIRIFYVRTLHNARVDEHRRTTTHIFFVLNGDSAWFSSINITIVINRTTEWRKPKVIIRIHQMFS